ncbi:MAG: hypothetical protein K6F09_08915, partial [Clostridiales bacterium]|nr:hypothetical protein [Clostridiales bacterium]
ALGCGVSACRHLVGEAESAVVDRLGYQKHRHYLSDKVNKSVHWGRQDKHIPGTNNYKEERSYLTVSKEEIPDLIEQYAGTGRIIRRPDGSFNNMEICRADHVIGKNVNPNTGEETDTVRFSIRYSKEGVHISPAKED